MAIDSADKRASVLNDGFCVILPIPDGTIDTADRQHLGWVYRGIAAGASVVSDLIKAITLQTVELTALPFKNPILKHEYTE